MSLGGICHRGIWKGCAVPHQTKTEQALFILRADAVSARGCVEITKHYGVRTNVRGTLSAVVPLWRPQTKAFWFT